MGDHSLFRAERAKRVLGKATKKRSYIVALALLLLAPASAWAGDHDGGIMVAAVVPPIVDLAPGVTSQSVSGVFTDGDRMASSELAAQRGGAGGAVPIAAAPQTIPQIVLWDELKAQLPGGGSQGTNRVNIQIR